MSFLVDTSVWSLALRRSRREDNPAVQRLAEALASRDSVFTTGLVLQELLQGFRGPRQHQAILERFAALPMIMPTVEDHVLAAELRNLCRRRGVQLGTIDSLLAQLAIANELTLLSSDRDFEHAAQHVPLSVWSG